MDTMLNIAKNKAVQEMFNVIPDGILISDAEGYIVWLNQAVLKRINLTANEVIGQHCNDLEANDVFKPSLTKMVVEQKTAIKGVQVHFKYKGRDSSFITSGYPIKNDNGETKLILIHSQYLPDIIESTSKIDEAYDLLQRYSNEIKRMQLHEKEALDNNYFLSRSSKYNSAIDTADQISSTDSTVLLTGETGVGKNIFAKRIHHLSSQANGPFIQINCGAIPENLIESELFGYKKAAFTGASPSGKAGLIKMADKGTLFLDEIGELPMQMQVKLLHFLQDMEFTPIGSVKPEKVDVRVIAATNKDLYEEMNEGKFRLDLFYRLNVLPIYVPALHERKEDIIGLVQFFLDKFNKKYKKACSLSSEVAEELQNYSWPGNIRELENLTKRFVLTCQTSNITLSDLPQYMKSSSKTFSFDKLTKSDSLTNYLDNIERDIIEKALIEFKTTRKTADKLGITQSLLMRRIKKYDINV